MVPENLKTDVAFWLSIINVFVLLFNFFRKLYTERIYLAVEVVGSRPYGDSRNTALEITIINNSMSPVSIDSIEVNVTDSSGALTTGKVVGRYELSKRSKETFKGVTKIVNEQYFYEVPFQLSPKGSTRGWHRVNFEHIAITDLSHFECELIIYCNSKKKTFNVSVPKSERMAN